MDDQLFVRQTEQSDDGNGTQNFKSKITSDKREHDK